MEGRGGAGRAKATLNAQTREKEKLEEGVMATQLETETTSRGLKLLVKVQISSSFQFTSFLLINHESQEVRPGK